MEKWYNLSSNAECKTKLNLSHKWEKNQVVMDRICINCEQDPFSQDKPQIIKIHQR
jgi:hypothetical protein